jgi:hypothetical protein
MPNPNHDKMGRFSSGHGLGAGISAGLAKGHAQRNGAGGTGRDVPPSELKTGDKVTVSSGSGSQSRGDHGRVSAINHDSTTGTTRVQVNGHNHDFGGGGTGSSIYRHETDSSGKPYNAKPGKVTEGRRVKVGDKVSFDSRTGQANHGTVTAVGPHFGPDGGHKVTFADGSTHVIPRGREVVVHDRPSDVAVNSMDAHNAAAMDAGANPHHLADRGSAKGGGFARVPNDGYPENRASADKVKMKLYNSPKKRPRLK